MCLQKKGFKFQNRKKYNISQIKGFIAVNMSKVNIMPYKWETIETGRYVNKRNIGREKVYGCALTFLIEDKFGHIQKYKITSCDAADTISNYWLIHKHILQKTFDILNGLTTSSEAFSEFKLLTAESESDPYKILGVTPDMSLEEIKKVYLTLCKLYHPDKFGREGEEIFKRIQKAWEEIEKHNLINSK